MEDSFEEKIARLHALLIILLLGLILGSSHNLLDKLHDRRTVSPGFFAYYFDLCLSEVVVESLWHLWIKLQEAIQQSPEIKSL